MTDDEIIAIGLRHGFDEPDRGTLTGQGERDRRICAGEYPVGESLIATVRECLQKAGCIW